MIGSWCRFTGWNAKTFAFYNDKLYFGDLSGNVNWAYQGGNDNGSPITATLQCAFNWYDNPGRLKRMTLIQPLLTVASATAVSLTLGVDTDFSNTTLSGAVQTGTSTALWDTAIWDQALWAGPYQTQPWVSVNGLGKALAVKTQLIYNLSSALDTPQIQVNAFNTICELGGMI